MENDKDLKLFKDWQLLLQNHVKEITNLLTSLRSISNEYVESKQSDKIASFNVFRIISDLYYRENFHSDIINFLLNPDENHRCGSIFLKVFIQMLNKTGKNIDFNAYRDAFAVREEGKIDILIKSDSSKRAIIIENKINNAGDMWRQLPRYYDYVSQNNYNIDAIVYLPLAKNKEPDMQDWNSVDKANVCPLLVIIPAYDKSGAINLVDDWLHRSILLINNLDVVSTLRQYSDLLTKLNTNIMDIIVLEKFYNELLQDDNLKTAQSIRNMLNDLPEYLASRIHSRFSGKCSPFSKIWIYKAQDVVFEEAIINNVYYKMDIWCNENGYTVFFWNPQDQGDRHATITEVEFSQFVHNTNALSDFDIDAENGFSSKKQFSFFDESKLYNFIEQLLHELSEHIRKSLQH